MDVCEIQSVLATHKGRDRILSALALCDYLTAAQLTRLLYAASSDSYARKALRALAADSLVLALPGRFVTSPTVYTITAKGARLLAALGIPCAKRVKHTEEQVKAANLFFIKHTIAVSDVLVTALLLSQTQTGIALTRLYTERSLKRKIYVREQHRTLCIEPDASLEFTIHGKWSDFFHVEVYRTLPPADWRFKQKIAGYVTYALTGQHEDLFQTPALSIAVIAAGNIPSTSAQMAQMLKRWTEGTLTESNHPEQGVRFFFRSGDTATASPAELFLTPFWQQPFSDTKTPLLVRE